MLTPELLSELYAVPHVRRHAAFERATPLVVGGLARTSAPRTDYAEQPFADDIGVTAFVNAYHKSSIVRGQFRVPIALETFS